MTTMTVDAGWVADAECRGKADDPERVTVDLCRACPVADECLADALLLEENWRYSRIYYRGGVTGPDRHRHMLAAHGDPVAAFETLVAFRDARTASVEANRRRDRHRNRGRKTTA